MCDGRTTPVVVTYLQMLSPDQLHAAPTTQIELRQAEVACPELNRFLYTAVGGEWNWIDRLKWDYDQWQDYLDRAELTTWIAYQLGTPAGYFELERTARAVEIRSFGLLTQFTGRGFGGDLLTRAIRAAWRLEPGRVWLHTCELDSPAALQNYRSRGFEVYKAEIEYARLPHRPPGPWPGHDRK